MPGRRDHVLLDMEPQRCSRPSAGETQRYWPEEAETAVEDGPGSLQPPQTMGEAGV